MKDWLVRIVTEDGDQVAAGVFRGGHDEESAKEWAKGLWVPPRYEREVITLWVEVTEVKSWEKLWRDPVNG